MTDIAREMGVAHGSLYNYVESKEALFLLLIERWGIWTTPRNPTAYQDAVDDADRRAIARANRVGVSATDLDGAIPRRRPSDPQRNSKPMCESVRADRGIPRARTSLKGRHSTCPSSVDSFSSRSVGALRADDPLRRRLESAMAAFGTSIRRSLLASLWETVTFFARHHTRSRPVAA